VQEISLGCGGADRDLMTWVVFDMELPAVPPPAAAFKPKLLDCCLRRGDDGRDEGPFCQTTTYFIV